MSADYVLVSDENSVRTLTMNRPEQLNGWTASMMAAIRAALNDAANDPTVKAVVLTGKGRYFSAGASFAGLLMLCLPRQLHEKIVENSRNIFVPFIRFPKPIVAAVNGPAIGGGVTSAALCDAIVAAESATFSTPFGRLHIPPEGCSPARFPMLMSAADTRKMLHDNHVASAAEARDMGLVTSVVPAAQVVAAAQQLCQRWIADGKQRWLVERNCVADYERINEREAVAIADAFLSLPFLLTQVKFNWQKKKLGLCLFFALFALSCPVWWPLLRVPDRLAYLLLAAVAALLAVLFAASVF